MLAEAVEFLNVKAGGRYVDATLGAGGHAQRILNSADCELIGFDRDPAAIAAATERLKHFAGRFTAIHSSFANLGSELESRNMDAVDGVLADLGVSSIQLDTPSRGFSFQEDAPLDMRMDPQSGSETAADLLARLSEEEIANVIYEFGEERFSRRIARRIVAARKEGAPVKSTKQLAELVRRSVPFKRNRRTDPATKTFQALRIAVNGELKILGPFLRTAVDLLKTNGRLVVISFHSLEDRIVKRTFQNLTGRCFCPRGFPECQCGAATKVEILTRKPIVASESEQESNPRSRSAKLRACRKI